MTPRSLPELVTLVGMVRDAGHEPRLHGNGFVQLDLGSSVRLHFWGDPRIPQQSRRTPIHDHVFSFESRCYRGRLLNILYRAIPSAAGHFRLYEAVPHEGSNTLLYPVEGEHRVDMRVLSAQSVQPGEVYFCPRSTYHETIPDGLTITAIAKNGPTLAQRRDGPRPRVAVPANIEPDNEFHRHAHDHGLLWQIIEDALRRE